MCAMFMGVFGGNPERFTTNVPVAAVTLPAASLVTTSVTVASPRPEASAPAIAGFSFAGNSVVVNVGFAGPVGVGEDEPQPETRTPKAAHRRERRFIRPTP